MFKIILGILLGFSSHVSDRGPDGETPAERAQRMIHVAEDIYAAAGQDRHKAAALLTLAKKETSLSRWVGRGCIGKHPKGTGDCDAGLARSYWQVQENGCPEGWAHPRGSRAAQKQLAVCAIRLWRAAYRRCKKANPDPLAGAYSGYWTACRGLSSANSRARYHKRILARLWVPCSGTPTRKDCKRAAAALALIEGTNGGNQDDTTQETP